MVLGRDTEYGNYRCISIDRTMHPVLVPQDRVSFLLFPDRDVGYSGFNLQVLMHCAVPGSENDK